MKKKQKKEKVIEKIAYLVIQLKKLLNNSTFNRVIAYDKATHKLTFLKNGVEIGSYICPTYTDRLDYCCFVDDYLRDSTYNLEETIQLGQEKTDIIVNRFVALIVIQAYTESAIDNDNPIVLYDLKENKEA